jgi:hypothetical protein
MFKNLPRQVFGKLQAKLLPKYFALGSVTLLLQLITLPSLPAATQKASTKALSLAFAMTVRSFSPRLDGKARRISPTENR